MLNHDRPDVSEVFDSRRSRGNIPGLDEQITKVKQLKKLPMTTLIREDSGIKLIKTWRGTWHICIDGRGSILDKEVRLPVRVLYQPEGV